MEGEGNGNKDEFFYLNSGVNSEGSRDSGGRPLGNYLATTKGGYRKKYLKLGTNHYTQYFMARNKVF